MIDMLNRTARHWMRASLQIIAGLCWVAAIHAAEVKPSPSSEALVIIDTHAHVARSVHDVGGTTVRQAIRFMDELRVERTIVLPPPFPPGHRGAYGRREIGAAIRDYPKRFSLVAGGESLNPMIHDIAPDRVSASDVLRFKKEAALIVASGAVGFGEITAEHFSSGRGGHPYESTRPDHPLFLVLADIAAQSEMLIDLHMEAIPRDMDMPERQRRGPNPARLAENISAFERLLEHNPKAIFVWAHAGWDLSGERNVALMRALLSRHPNLNMSIKLDANAPPRTAPFAPEGALRADWLALLVEFSDRFVIGSDQFFDEGGDRLALARRLIDALPTDVARRIARENAIRIYRLEGK